MTWNEINVFQWQQINELYANTKGLTDLDISVKAAAILTNQTEHQIDSLPVSELKPILDGIAFLHVEVQPKPAKYIKVGGRKYKCIFDIRQMPAARYIESKHFSTDVNGNLHRIAACMVMPMKRTIFGWRVTKYDASKHDQYAQDMLEAPITNVLGSVVFFYQVFRLWTRLSKDYLTAEMMTSGMTKYQAQAAHQALCDILDGYIKPHWLPSMRRSRWNRLMRSAPSNSLTTFPT